MISAGIDPGDSDGACVWLDGEQVVGVCSWHKTRRKVGPYDVAGWYPSVGHWSERAHCLEAALAYLLEGPAADVVSVEWPVYFARKGKTRSPASMVTLAYAAGSAAACVPGQPDKRTVHHVPVEDWRARVLGIAGNSPADAAKARAIAAVTGATRRGKPVVPWRMVWPEGIEMTDHIAEAACVARWPVHQGNP